MSAVSTPGGTLLPRTFSLAAWENLPCSPVWPSGCPSKTPVLPAKASGNTSNFPSAPLLGATPLPLPLPSNQRVKSRCSQRGFRILVQSVPFFVGQWK